MTPTLVFALLGVAVAAYALTAGADFGGGVWDLLASGPRKRRQRERIADAIAPIWEVNHIWMIFVVVLLFTVFPDAFAVIATALHIPMLLALVGIVLRGSAFVFRAYGLQPDETRARWGQVFAWTSAITPVFLGMILGGLSSGAVTVEAAGDHGRPMVTSGFLAGWTSPLAIAVGLFALALFALLAAAYMARESQAGGETELADDFRRRALLCELVAGALAAVVLWRAAVDSPALFSGLLHAPWSIPAQITTALSATAAIVFLVRRQFLLAQVFVMIQVGLVVLGWGLAMDGHLLLPNLHIADAGAQPAVLAALPWVLAGGGLLLGPALWWLYRLFKG